MARLLTLILLTDLELRVDAEEAGILVNEARRLAQVEEHDDQQELLQRKLTQSLVVT